MALRCLILALALVLTGQTAQAQYAGCRPVFQAQPPALNACADGGRYTLAIVGDVLLHSPLQRQGYATGFHTIWGAAIPFLQAADFAIANLEGPVAPGLRSGGRQGRDPGRVFDGSVYTSYPMFNYHPTVIPELRAAGVDMVTTANNHALDRSSAGADATVAQLSAAGMPFVGTVAGGAPRQFALQTGSRLGRIVWIACTYSTNGIPDRQGQVLHCYNQREALLALVSAHAARSEVAAVFVLPHWGNEYQARAASAERGLARALVAAGATAVIGTHPHVVQNWEILPGRGMNVPVIYSTGNFVSGQTGLDRQTGMLAWLELCRSRPGADMGPALRSRVAVASAGWLAIRMARTAQGRQLVIADSSGIMQAAAASHNLIEGRVPGYALMPRLACTGAQASGTTSALAVGLQ
ncbi:CapA family protein [Roseisalinus antarcticus]|uniref:CapA family protein n=1 Tax=Roseisalinus antarcticus TaxID=254357 RepID=UPI0013565EEA|nr:CapA family protein [Roseisalinus antarcticus]